MTKTFLDDMAEIHKRNICLMDFDLHILKYEFWHLCKVNILYISVNETTSK